MKPLIREVEVISSKIKKDEEEGGVAGEWKYAAMVMDRFDLNADADADERANADTDADSQ